MTEDIIPEACRQFLLRNIDSIAEWEALLLLRSEPDRGWTAAELARRLYIDETETARILRHLAQRHLLAVMQPEAVYRYQTADPATSDMVDQLADLYRLYLIPITHLIHSKPRNGMQAFADAFRLRKD